MMVPLQPVRTVTSSVITFRVALGDTRMSVLEYTPPCTLVAEPDTWKMPSSPVEGRVMMARGGSFAGGLPAEVPAVQGTATFALGTLLKLPGKGLLGQLPFVW